MHYLVVSKPAPAEIVASLRVVADGEMVSFEQPWTFGVPLIALVEDTAALEAVKARTGAAPSFNAFAVEAIEPPGDGQAFVLGGHMMRDIERFAPYAAAVPEVVKSFGGRFLARGGKVTPVAGAFVPDRAVLLEFPDLDRALTFYVSDRYAPLLKVRLATTEARLVIVSRSGAWPAPLRARAAAYLRDARQSGPAPNRL